MMRHQHKPLFFFFAKSKLRGLQILFSENLSVKHIFI